MTDVYFEEATKLLKHIEEFCSTINVEMMVMVDVEEFDREILRMVAESHRVVIEAKNKIKKQVDDIKHKQDELDRQMTNH